MADTWFKKVSKTSNFEAAWRAIQENGRSSKSELIRKEIAEFDQEAGKKLRSLGQRVAKRRYVFPAARGVAISKPGKKDKRPIVLASVEARIVQRAILQVLQKVEALQPYFRNPYSFGGIKKLKGETLSAVPAAIQAVLCVIENGATHVICSDIASFFTRISKNLVTNIISDAVDDPDFVALFQSAIKVELSNMQQLGSLASDFPTEDMGVAQGCSLSPLLGNIILHNFDKVMNEGDCACIRYIDDFIILAPSRKAAASRLKKAKNLLAELTMQTADSKTSREPISVREKFDFLGIEFNNGQLRPVSKSRTRFLESIRGACEQSQIAIKAYRSGGDLLKPLALLGTLKRIDGMIQGWGKHYHFCRDERFFANLDVEIFSIIKSYLDFYQGERSVVDDDKRYSILGLEFLSKIQRNPFEWKWKPEAEKEEAPKPVISAQSEVAPWE